MKTEILAEIAWPQALKAIEKLVGVGRPVDFCHLDQERLMKAARCIENMRENEPDNHVEPCFKELRKRLRRLDDLLRDPHPGLITWCEWYDNEVKSLLEFFKG